MSTQTLHAASPRFVSLHDEQVRRLHGAARLRVSHGTVWLTVTGKTDDHVLLPGDRFTIGHGSDVLVQALSGRACIMVSATALSWPQRVSATLQSATQRIAGALA